MSAQKELSDKIYELFKLKSEEFNPKIHLPLAEFIVNQLGLDRAYIFRITDIFRFYDESGFRFNSPGNTAGLYNVRHVGKLTNSAYLGYYPKLRISHWKSESFTLPWDSREELIISYKDKKVKVLRKDRVIPSTLIIGPLTLSMYKHEEIWRYKA